MPGAAATEAARVFARGRDTVIEPRKLWPSGLGAGFKGRISGCEEGRALAFADDPGWAEPLRRLWGACAAAEAGAPAAAPGDQPLQLPQDLQDGVVALLARWRSRWPARPVAVVPVPSQAHGAVVAALAAHIGRVGRLPVLDLLHWQGPPPDADAASGARVAALAQGLLLQPGAEVPAGPLLLVDARYRSGWTATVAAARLRRAGATAVLPLVLQQLP
jgi:ATP-dependent DNA helicase RecQ